MDGFSYTDIFATKGLEYLIIITFLVLLIPFWIILNKQVKITRQIQKTLGILSASILRIPQGLFYGKNHTWMYMEKSGIASVGLDDLLLHITGKIKFRNLKNPGETITKGDLLTEIDQEGKLLRIFSPVSGKIMETNPTLDENPGLLNEDPYGSGWIYKVKPSNWMVEARSCYFAEEATNWSENELIRFKDFLAVNMKNYTPGAPMVILQDGGELCDHSLSALPDTIWKDFQKEFLSPDPLIPTPSF
ncbi:MAG: glycine cleavage system protein H [Bacteroidales bacterium]|nr:glycine cleavage system protein H [Bacteroidales bacterium]